MSEPLEEYDFALALALQTQFDANIDSDDDLPTFDCNKTSTNTATSASEDINNAPPTPPSASMLSTSSTQQRANAPSPPPRLDTSDIMDPNLETIDPNPNIRELFLKFNQKYFWGRLEMVEVRWSPRMTLCAGICCYEGVGGLCSIRLSQPLLKYRPRNDLVETLLHEMIHAYLFVTQNNKDHDGHGPEFHKHMYRINKASGSNITVYHSFHDEVAAQRTHWWKCDGPCQRRPPYFGIVKRSMNRAPAPRDPWWSHHLQTCGGKYTKIKEPEDYGKKKSKDASKNKTTSSQDKNKNNVQQDDKNKKRKPGYHDLSKFFNNSSNNVLGGNTQDKNPRGVPLNSRLLKLNNDNNNDFFFKRKSKSKPVGKKPTSAVQLTNLLRLEGRLSVCHDAPAFKTKRLENLSKKIIFDDDDEDGGKEKSIKTVTSAPSNLFNVQNNKKRQYNNSHDSPSTSDKENDRNPKKFCPSKSRDVICLDSDNEGEVTLQSLLDNSEPPRTKKIKLLPGNFKSQDKEEQQKDSTHATTGNCSFTSSATFTTKQEFSATKQSSATWQKGTIPCGGGKGATVREKYESVSTQRSSFVKTSPVKPVPVITPTSPHKRLSISVEEEIKLAKKSSVTITAQSGTTGGHKNYATSDFKNVKKSTISSEKDNILAQKLPETSPQCSTSDQNCSSSENIPEIAGGTIFCPVCNQDVVTNNINAHIDSCLTLMALKNGDL